MQDQFKNRDLVLFRRKFHNKVKGLDAFSLTGKQAASTIPKQEAPNNNETSIITQVKVRFDLEDSVMILPSQKGPLVEWTVYDSSSFKTRNKVSCWFKIIDLSHSAELRG